MDNLGGSMNIRLQQEIDWLRAQNRAMNEEMASRSVRRCPNGPTNAADLVTLRNGLRLQNTLLRSELETLACFNARLASCIRIFPDAATTPTWIYAVKVMSALSRNEVVALARAETPMWTNDKLNLNEYYSNFFPWYARNAPGFVHEASRASAFVPVDALSLVTDLMDPTRAQKIFPSIIGDLSMESPHQEFQMINMDFMPFASPQIQYRNAKIIRCFKHIENDTWVISDISKYFSSYAQNLRPKFMRFPSGYIVQHVSNGVSKVTIIDHWVYKEHEQSVDHQFREYVFKPNSGFGAHKWLEALQRHCYNTCVVTFRIVHLEIPMLDPVLYTNLLRLSTDMVNRFCTGVCGITGQSWKSLRSVGVPVNNIRKFTRESRDRNGVPFVLGAAISVVKIQAKPEDIFGLIKRTKKKDIWSYLQTVGDMKEDIRIKRSPNSGNEVSVFSIERTGSKDLCLIQETYVDAKEVLIIHACIEASYLSTVIYGGDLSDVELLPCGFSILPCGQQECVLSAGCQVMAGQDMDTRVGFMENLVNGALGNVQNALHVSSQSQSHLP